MIILVGNWKKKVLKILTVLVLFMAFAAAVPTLTGLLYRQVPAVGKWFQEEQPTGNPMRVEEEKKQSNFEKAVDQLVIKLQEFYYEE